MIISHEICYGIFANPFAQYQLHADNFAVSPALKVFTWCVKEIMVFTGTT